MDVKKRREVFVLNNAFAAFFIGFKNMKLNIKRTVNSV
jgi:hypothetical protein